MSDDGLSDPARENLRFWIPHCKTPKESTKNYNKKGFKGTDINAQYRMRCMTEMFGPIGIGWGYEIKERWREESNGSLFAYVLLQIWYKPAKMERTFTGEIIGGTEGNFNPDEIWKSCITDALGKCMAQLGIGADVYMGEFDGKYDPRPPSGQGQSGGYHASGQRQPGGQQPGQQPANQQQPSGQGDGQGKYDESWLTDTEVPGTFWKWKETANREEIQAELAKLSGYAPGKLGTAQKPGGKTWYVCQRYGPDAAPGGKAPVNFPKMLNSLISQPTQKRLEKCRSLLSLDDAHEDALAISGDQKQALTAFLDIIESDCATDEDRERIAIIAGTLDGLQIDDESRRMILETADQPF